MLDGLANGEAVFVSLRAKLVRGLFITFEGIEHCGKTTQSEYLVKSLTSDGHDVLLTREPGGTPLGVEIRELVLHSDYQVSTLCELLLFAADRAQHVSALIEPALANGQIVISDRFFDSTRAYQGYGRGIDPELIDRTISIATTGLTPDLTVLVDIDIETSRARGDDAADRIERNTDAFFNRVRNGFLEIAKRSPERSLVLDGRNTIEELASQVRIEVDRRLTER